MVLRLCSHVSQDSEFNSTWQWMEMYVFKVHRKCIGGVYLFGTKFDSHDARILVELDSDQSRSIDEGVMISRPYLRVVSNANEENDPCAYSDGFRSMLRVNLS